MGSRVDRFAINLGLAVLVFVGISASISPWLDALYSEIAVWAVILGIPLAVGWRTLRSGIGRSVAYVEDRRARKLQQERQREQLRHTRPVPAPTPAEVTKPLRAVPPTKD